MSNEFETKLASAGEMFEKLVKESGLSISDFTDQEAIDAITVLMGGDAKTASETPPAGAGATPPAGGAAPAPAGTPAPKTASQEQPKFTYGEVMAEVTKFAAANNYDLTKATPAELDDAVAKMAEHMVQRQTPEFQAKEAAFKEKVSEAEAMGRVMAHAYVDELGKIASKTAHETPADKKDEEKEKAEKKAALITKLRGKTAGELPPALAAHMHGGKGKDDEDEDKKKKDEEEKKAAAEFAKRANDRAAEKLIVAGIDPTTGNKFASEEARLEAAANLVLETKGYR